MLGSPTKPRLFLCLLATMSMSTAKGCPLVLRVALVHGFLNLLGLLRGLAWALTQGVLGLVRRKFQDGCRRQNAIEVEHN